MKQNSPKKLKIKNLNDIMGNGLGQFISSEKQNFSSDSI